MTSIELIEKMKGFKYLEEILNQEIEKMNRFFAYVILDNQWNQIEFSHYNVDDRNCNNYLSIYLNCLIQNDCMNDDELPHMIILLDYTNEESFNEKYHIMLMNKESIIKAYKRKYIIENV